MNIAYGQVKKKEMQWFNCTMTSSEKLGNNFC